MEAKFRGWCYDHVLVTQVITRVKDITRGENWVLGMQGLSIVFLITVQLSQNQTFAKIGNFL